MEKNPHVIIEAEYSGFSGYYQKLVTQLASGNAPDVFQSDQGWQYQMKEFQETLLAHGITQSMSRKATCLDNAIVENFFSILKREMYYGEEVFDSPEELIIAIEEYIHYYNHYRIKEGLGGMSPVDYRLAHLGKG